MFGISVSPSTKPEVLMLIRHLIPPLARSTYIRETGMNVRYIASRHITRGSECSPVQILAKRIWQPRGRGM